MENVIFIWLKHNTTLEEIVPLLWNAERNIRLGSNNNFNIICLEGYDFLPISYVKKLKALKYNIINAEEIYLQQSEKFKALDRFGNYEKYCFLRWNVLREIFPSGHVIHYDGDVVFNSTPEEISTVLEGYNFVLQGCPAVTSIVDKLWLDSYLKHLAYFATDVDNYSKIAWTEREGWEDSFKNRLAGYRFRPIISSDQDFISHLIHTDRLPQEIPPQLNSDQYMFFQNPLVFFELFRDKIPFTYYRKNGIDYINDKKVAIWHMQSDFCQYLNFCHQRGILNKFSRAHNHIGHKGLDYYVLKILEKIKIIPSGKNRLGVYKLVFEQKDFSFCFNKKVFWEKDIF